MARRKKRMATRSRRRKVGAMPKNAAMSVVGIVAGAIVGRLIAKKVLPNVNEKIKNAGVLAIGALLMPKLIKSDLGKSIGHGMIASGGIGLVGSFLPAIAGDGDMIEFPVQVGEVDDNISLIAGDDDVMSGSSDQYAMAGDDLSLISGDEENDY